MIAGHAVSLHSEPRYTEELDLFVEATLANGRRLRKALVEFGLGNVAPKPIYASGLKRKAESHRKAQ